MVFVCLFWVIWHIIKSYCLVSQLFAAVATMHKVGSKHLTLNPDFLTFWHIFNTAQNRSRQPLRLKFQAVGRCLQNLSLTLKLPWHSIFLQIETTTYELDIKIVFKILLQLKQNNKCVCFDVTAIYIIKQSWLISNGQAVKNIFPIYPSVKLNFLHLQIYIYI